MRRSMSSEEATIDALGLFVYPAEEQSEEQQAKDERECVEWAQGEMGDSPPEGAETETTGGAGSAEESGRERGGREGLRGAARGAAAGAVVDEVREPDLDDIDRDDLGDADSPEEARKNLDKAVEDDHSAAKVGAVVGAVAGRSRARGEQAATEQQQAQVAEQQSALANDAAADALRKAVKACLEARGYSVE